MSEDLIRRSDAIKTCINIINTRTDKRVGIRGGTTPPEEETIKIIYERVPTFEPKRGEWLWDNGYFCSECQGEAFSQKFTMLIDEPMYFRSDFCPYCGADMRKGADDE